MDLDEQARPGRLTGSLATLLFLLTVGSVAAVDGLSHFFFPHQPSKFLAGEFKGRQSGEGFWGGAPSRRIEKKLEERSLAGAVLRSFWSELLYASIRHTRRTVVPGRDGWFYVTSTVQPRPYAPVDLKVCSGWVEAGEVALRSQEIDLVVALVPSKVSIYPEHLPPTFEAPPPFYDELRDELRARGAWVLDIQQLFRARRDELLLFRRDDTHWSLQGSWLAAQEIARAVGERYPPFLPRVDVEVEREVFRHQPGDLLRMADFRPGGWLAGSLRHEEERAVVSFESPRLDRQVYLTGDSFAVTGYLGAYLSAAFGTDMGDTSVAGQGLAGSLGQVMSGLARNKQHDVRLVIWAFVQRQVREGFDVCYDPLMEGLAVLYAPRYREVLDRSQVHAGKARTAAAAAGYVLPGNGTCALRVTTSLAAPRRAGALGWYSLGAAAEMPGRELPAGQAVTDLPLVAPGFLRGTALSFDGLPAPSQLARATVVTAYAGGEAVALERLEPAGGLAYADGRLSGSALPDARVGVPLPRSVRADGVHALGVVLLAPDGAAGTGRLHDAEGGPLGDEFPVRPVDGRVLCILPIAPPSEEARRTAVERVELRLAGLPEVEVARVELLTL